MITIKTDIAEPVAMIKRLGGSTKSFTGKILRAVGRGGVSVVKKGYSKHLGKKSGKLKKEIKASLSRDKQTVTIYSRATNAGARYGFILAAGSPEHHLASNDWFQSEVARYEQSGEFRDSVQKALDKEVARLVNK
jgi:hypothetical protein